MTGVGRLVQTATPQVSRNQSVSASAPAIVLRLFDRGPTTGDWIFIIQFCRLQLDRVLSFEEIPLEPEVQYFGPFYIVVLVGGVFEQTAVDRRSHWASRVD